MLVDLDGFTVEAKRSAHGWRFDDARAVPFHRAGGRITLFDGIGRLILLPDALDRGGAGGAGGDIVEAPMPGLVREIAVSVGDAVAEGDRLAVLEAMKMEHVMRAPRDGVIAALPVAAGGQVEAGAVLARLEPEDTE